jgi:AP-1 complex subunit gamma-1
MSARLRDLIRGVRSCKTAAEERAVIQRESAIVRQQLHRGDNRGPNLLKLMYMSMLGYATEFGQLEVVKLLAESDFASKRVGYLALCVLLDESQEVLTLAENHIKRDLVSTGNPFITSLALDAVANIAGADMSRDMMNEVYGLLGSSNTHVRKKAALAAQRGVRKAPELVDVFLEDERLMSILNERNHGILVCFVTLLNECLASENGAPYIAKYATLIPAAVKQLNQLVMSGYATEHEVGGIADPFLQVKLLQFLRIVGRGSEDAAEAMNNVLAQAATNTASERNVGCAVLYECVRTILAIECDDSLRLLAYNILGRFMDRDNNSRFVALSMFLDVVRVDRGVAQRHRATVIDCLRDVDLSIRKRALQLTVALIDDSNVRLMASDLVAYLGVCTDEMKEPTTRQLCGVIERQSPSSEWRIEMSIRLFRSPQARIAEAFAEHFITAVTRADDETAARATAAMWEEFKVVSADPTTHVTRQGLLLAAVWLCGEYAQLLVPKVAGADVVIGACGAMATEGPTALVRQFGLNAVAKIAAKFDDTHSMAQGIFDLCATSMDCEIAQRAAEYSVMLTEFKGELLQFCFSPGGAIAAQADTEELVLPATPLTTGPTDMPSGAAAKPAAKKEDFMESLFSAGPPATSSAPASTTSSVPAAAANTFDSIFGPGPAASPSPAAQSPATATPTASLDPFGPPTTSPKPATPAAPAAATGPKKVSVHDAPEFDIAVAAATSGPSADVTFFLSAKVPVSKVVLLVAVPKSCTLELKPTVCGDSAQAGGVLDHKMVVRNNAGQALAKMAMKVKLTFTCAAGSKAIEFQFSKELPL